MLEEAASFSFLFRGETRVGLLDACMHGIRRGEEKGCPYGLCAVMAVCRLPPDEADIQGHAGVEAAHSVTVRYTAYGNNVRVGSRPHAHVHALSGIDRTLHDDTMDT